MIYRVHRIEKLTGHAGSFVGYINICPSNMLVDAARASLLEANIISSNWFTSNELRMQAVRNYSSLSNSHSYILSRATPRHSLYYLWPVDKKVEVEKKSNSYWSGAAISSDTYTVRWGDPSPVAINQYVGHIYQQQPIQYQAVNGDLGGAYPNNIGQQNDGNNGNNQ